MGSADANIDKGPQQWSAPGSNWSSSSPWTIAGDGYGFYSGSTSDGLNWDYQPLNGNGAVYAQVDGYQFPNDGYDYGQAQTGARRPEPEAAVGAGAETAELVSNKPYSPQ